MKRIVSVFLTLTMLTAAMPVFNAATAAAEDAGVTITLDPSNASPFNNGEFEGWGTALCWWANRLGYSEELTEQSAKAFFSEDGLSLDIARYNLGGGDDPTHNHITRSDSKVPGIWETFKLSEDGKDVEEITYDITNDQNQLNIAKAALAANPNLYFEGFSNSAPYFMTKTGCTGGGGTVQPDGSIEADGNVDNLKDDMYDDFAKFIADGTELLAENGIVFQSYSPMNEPDTNYWGYFSPKQEGCHFTPDADHQSKMIVETRNALDAAGLDDVLVAGMDETSLKSTANNLGKLTTEAREALGRVDTHTYSDRGYHAQVKAKAQELNKNLWMSEVDKGGNGFVLADMIIEDMNGMQPSAWVMWDIVDKHRDSNFTAPDGSKPEAGATLNALDSLWGVGMGNHDTQTLELANKYYFFGQFTKYIKPGMTIIASSSSTLAAYDKRTGEIVVVAPNSSNTDKNVTIDMRAFSHTGAKAQPIRTENTVNGEKWAAIDPIDVNNKQFNATLKANTITTFVVSDGIAEITKADMDAEGMEYEYFTPASYSGYDRYFAVYNNDGTLKAVTKNQSSASLTDDFTGCTYKLLVWDGMTPVAEVSDVTKKTPLTYATINGATTVVAGVDYTYTATKSNEENPTVTWSVSDEDVAQISENGVLTAKKGGSVTVTAEFADGTDTSVDVKVLNTDQTIRIVNKHSGLDLEAKGINSGAALMQYENRNRDTGAWKLVPTADSKFNIVNANSDYLLVNADGLKVSNTVEATDNNAKWELINHGGYYEIYNVGAQKSLDVSGQSVANGGNVILYKFGNGDNELWSFVEVVGELDHIVPEVVDYSKAYENTNYNFVSNVAAATNDFSIDEGGFVLSGNFSSLASDPQGIPALAVQNATVSSGTREGAADLNLENPITCASGQIAHISFDVYMPCSNGTSEFSLKNSEDAELASITVTSWGSAAVFSVGGEVKETMSDGARQYVNNNSERSGFQLSNGAHVDIKIDPANGSLTMIVTNKANPSATKTYSGTVSTGTDIAKYHFKGAYSSYARPLYVADLRTNIITEKAE